VPLFAELDHHDERINAGRLSGLDVSVTLLFAVNDEYLSPELARHLAGLFTHADLHLVGRRALAAMGPTHDRGQLHA
jgi:hypothetical protein